MSLSVSAKINTKNILWVLFLGGAVAASCALPGYETDPNLKDTSSTSVASSSSSGTTSGGGKGGAGQGGQTGTGGAGGASGEILVDCKLPVGEIAPGALCDKFIVSDGTGTGACPFFGLSENQCCIGPVKCGLDAISGKHLWRLDETVAQCHMLNKPVGCPYVCGQPLPCDGFMGAAPPPECQCININPMANGGPLNECFAESMPGICSQMPDGQLFKRLSCTGVGEGVGVLEVTPEACCNFSTMKCGNDPAKSCDSGQDGFGKKGQCPK